MATTFKKFSGSSSSSAAAAAVSLVILFSNLLALSSEHMIAASPAVLPYVTAPNISSFFPTPTNDTQWPLSSADPPRSEALEPVPNSGEECQDY
ncbi:uncharacterized protein LOC110636664 [Hevea brasiliensis]|uniref:uncharacterized protein LOC110636664 n=1 Tax=Hevea brasiliensis TaxID=3981 RepID=UPI0025DD4F0F|nr:uncharacterized protein LOC110636664 [Hevea brasiliensis]